MWAGYPIVASLWCRVSACLACYSVTIAQSRIRGTSSPGGRNNPSLLSRFSNATQYAHPSNLIFLALISDTSVHTEGTEGTDGTEVAGLTPQRPLTVPYLNGTSPSGAGTRW